MCIRDRLVSNENQVIPANQVDGGTISYADDVIAIIAGLAATEVSGVAGMSGGVVGGIAELLGRKNLTKGVKVEVGNEEAAIDLSIVIDFGFNLRDVSVAVQENVKKAVESMTGLRVVECNINIPVSYTHLLTFYL